MTTHPDMDAASALHDPMPGMFIPRELWQPDRNEQLAAVEILMASTIPRELRDLLRELEHKLATRRAP